MGQFLDQWKVSEIILTYKSSCKKTLAIIGPNKALSYSLNVWKIFCNKTSITLCDKFQLLSVSSSKIFFFIDFRMLNTNPAFKFLQHIRNFWISDLKGQKNHILDIFRYIFQDFYKPYLIFIWENCNISLSTIDTTKHATMLRLHNQFFD